MAGQRRAGTLFLRIDGQLREIVGSFSYNLGAPKRDGLVGPDIVHGYKELPQIPMIEGEARDKDDLDVVALLNITDATITLELANGKTIALRNAWYAADGDIGTEEANIQLKFQGKSADEIT